MPFQSEKQRRFMWANHPAIARRWAHKYGSTAPDTKKLGNAAKRRLKKRGKG